MVNYIPNTLMVNHIPNALMVNYIPNTLMVNFLCVRGSKCTISSIRLHFVFFCLFFYIWLLQYTLVDKYCTLNKSLDY